MAAGATLAVAVGGTNDWTAANVDSLRGNTAAFPAGSYLGLDTSDGNFTYSSSIAAIGAAGGLNKLGTGVLTLTGSNTYTGPTTVSAGTLQIGNGASGEALASASIIDNATLAFNNADSLIYGGTISGSGGLLKLGGGTVAISGGSNTLIANTYSGPTTVAGGVLAVGSTNNPFLAGGGVPGNLTVNGGALFQCLQQNILSPRRWSRWPAAVRWTWWATTTPSPT